jgi:hypothetical protein
MVSRHDSRVKPPVFGSCSQSCVALRTTANVCFWIVLGKEDVSVAKFRLGGRIRGFEDDLDCKFKRGHRLAYPQRASMPV